jgi:TonB family protein
VSVLRPCLLAALLFFVAPAWAHDSTSGGEPPTFIGQVRAPYPPGEIRARHQGTVLLRILVKADSRVGRVLVADPSGYPALDRAARQSAVSFRFRAGSRHGVHVDRWVMVPVNFALQPATGDDSPMPLRPTDGRFPGWVHVAEDAGGNWYTKAFELSYGHRGVRLWLLRDVIRPRARRGWPNVRSVVEHVDIDCAGARVSTLVATGFSGAHGSGSVLYSSERAEPRAIRAHSVMARFSRMACERHRGRG